MFADLQGVEINSQNSDDEFIETAAKHNQIQEVKLFIFCFIYIRIYSLQYTLDSYFMLIKVALKCETLPLFTKLLTH